LYRDYMHTPAGNKAVVRQMWTKLVKQAQIMIHDIGTSRR